MRNAALFTVFLKLSWSELQSTIWLGCYGKTMAADDLLQVVNYFHILMIMAIVVDDK